jgi:hypothetical protein
LHHKDWPQIVSLNLLNFAALFACVCVVAAALASGAWLLAAGAAVLPFVYATGMLFGLYRADALLRRQWAMIATLFIRQIDEGLPTNSKAAAASVCASTAYPGQKFDSHSVI